MSGRLATIGGKDEGPFPDSEIILILSWWLRVARGLVVGGQEVLMILRGCGWTGEIFSSFPRPFGGASVRESSGIGNLWYWDIQSR